MHITKKKHFHMYQEQPSGSSGEREGEGQDGVWSMGSGVWDEEVQIII